MWLCLTSKFSSIAQWLLLGTFQIGTQKWNPSFVSRLLSPDCLSSNLGRSKISTVFYSFPGKWKTWVNMAWNYESGLFPSSFFWRLPHFLLYAATTLRNSYPVTPAVTPAVTPPSPALHRILTGSWLLLLFPAKLLFKTPFFDLAHCSEIDQLYV